MASISDSGTNYQIEDSRTGWRFYVFDRLPISYAWVLVLAIVVAGGEQLLEMTLQTSQPTPVTMVRRLLLPALAIYMLSMFKWLKLRTFEVLQALRPYVEIDDDTYSRYCRRMLHTSGRVQTVLLTLSVLLVTFAFVILRNPLPIAGRVYLPDNIFSSGVILITYSLLGWIGLLLVYISIENARILSSLGQRPLVVNALDPTPLLPFGQLSLLHSLAVVGITLVLLIALGQPSNLIDYLVIALTSLAGLLTLLLPIWGVHRQILAARNRLLLTICSELQAVQESLLSNTHPNTDELSQLTTRAEQLTKIQSLVLKSPTWPFRDAGSVIRAVLTAISPLTYFLLIEILRATILPLITTAQ